jgi:putative DNA primase/helicase
MHKCIQPSTGKDSTQSKLLPNNQDLDRFVAAVFKHADPIGYVSLRGFSDTKRDAPPIFIEAVRCDDPDFLQSVINRAREAANKAEPVVFCPPIVTFKNKVDASGDNVHEGVTLMVECDEAPSAALKILCELLGEPTIVVASGGEWKNPDTGEVEPKLHIHWRLKTPTRTEAEHKKLYKARQLAAKLVGSDASAVPLVHPLRWPGSWHRKNEPRLARIVSESDKEIDLDVALKWLHQATGTPEAASKTTTKIPSKLKADDIEDVAAAVALIPNDDIDWVDWNNLGMAIWAASGRSDEGGKIFAAWSAKSAKYNEEETRARWKHFKTSPPSLIGMGTLVYLAQQQQQKKTQRDDDADGGDVGGGDGAGGGGGGSVGEDNDGETSDTEAPHLSEEELALEFAAQYAECLRHVALWGKWLMWTGSVWMFDETRKAFSLARQICREAALTANKAATQRAIASAKTRAAVVSLAGDDRRLAATHEQWDQEPMLLNTPDGIVDLRTGTLLPATPDEYMTKMTAVAPGGACPLWRKFLKTVTGNDADLEKYLQVAAGYSLTGLTSEEVLLFLFGHGQNGKSVFIRTISGVLGTYHTTAPIETFLDSPTDRHPTELAGLRGARIVTAAETEQGRRWSETKIKTLTGGDRVAARFMRQDFFEFVPQFTLWIHGNHKPGLRTVDKAIARRLKLLPFTVTIPDNKRDNGLGEKLKDEWSGILAWMIEGCLVWQREGLVAPKVVLDATEEYLNSENTIEAWIEACCARDPQAWTGTTSLFSSWKNWAEENGEFAGGLRKFVGMLETQGFDQIRRNNARGFVGLKRDYGTTSAAPLAPSPAPSKPVRKPPPPVPSKPVRKPARVPSKPKR